MDKQNLVLKLFQKKMIKMIKMIKIGNMKPKHFHIISKQNI